MSMTIKEAIRCLHLPGDHLKNYDEYGLGVDDELKEAMQLAIAALRERAEREDPQPLSLEELRQMDGEPVFVKSIGISDEEWRIIFVGDHGNITAHVPGVDEPYFGSDYNKDWIAYHHKPKEATK